jgi:predicted esterase
MADKKNAGVTGPHASQPVVRLGPDLKKAAGAIILLHGRGASAESILGLYDEIGDASLVALAPQAAGHTWYPQSFLAPIQANQPYLDSALSKIESIVAEVLAAGIAGERIAILGFSQGACLTTEFVARHPRRYGAAMGLTGGLIGPEGTPRNYPGSLAGTPVFLGSSDPDPHVPFWRVEETRDVLSKMGAEIDLRRYPGMGHTVNEEEVDVCRELVRQMLSKDR